MAQLAIAEWTESHWCAHQDKGGNFCFGRNVRLELSGGKYLVRCCSCGNVRGIAQPRNRIRDHIRFTRRKVNKASISSLPSTVRDYHYRDITNATS